MSQNRGRRPARRTSNNARSAGMPGWAWLLIGALIAALLFLFVPRFLNKEEGGFFKPTPNPDALPLPASSDEAEMTPDAQGVTPKAGAEKAGADPSYSFYDMLPGDEVKLTDAQLAAMAKAEKQKADAAAAAEAKTGADATDDTALPKPIDAATAAAAPTAPAPAPAAARPAASAPAPTASSAKPAPVASTETNTTKPAATSTATPYILQAGAFGQAAQADELKAKVAMLGLNARVEEATVNGKTMFRVRMGPYATASELSAAKTKLGNGGLKAIPIKAK